MLKSLIAYRAYDGHTAKTAEQFASAICAFDCADEMCELARSQPARLIEELKLELLTT